MSDNVCAFTWRSHVVGAPTQRCTQPAWAHGPRHTAERAWVAVGAEDHALDASWEGGYSNLDQAVRLVADIDRARAVIRELKAAFARNELDGGVKAAPAHPLYVQAKARLAELHEALIILI